jgi:hypothetical protein
MCGFTWREPKQGKYDVMITQETGPFMGTITGKQTITITE